MVHHNRTKQLLLLRAVHRHARELDLSQQLLPLGDVTVQTLSHHGRGGIPKRLILQPLHDVLLGLGNLLFDDQIRLLQHLCADCLENISEVLGTGISLGEYLVARGDDAR